MPIYLGGRGCLYIHIYAYTTCKHICTHAYRYAYAHTLIRTHADIHIRAVEILNQQTSSRSLSSSPAWSTVFAMIKEITYGPCLGFTVVHCTSFSVNPVLSWPDWHFFNQNCSPVYYGEPPLRLDCFYAECLCGAHIIFFLRFLDVSPVYINRYFVKSVLYIPVAVLLLPSRLMLTSSYFFKGGFSGNLCQG